MSAGRRALAAALLVGALTTSAPRAWGQPIPISSFHIDNWEAAIFVRGHHREDDEQRGGGDFKETDTLFEEGLELSGRGYIYHPNMIEWNAALRVGATQQDIQINDDSLQSDGELLGYNLSALLLKEKQFSGRIFANLTDQFISRSFARPLDVEIRTEGFEVFAKGDFPMSLLFEHTDSTEQSNVRIEEEEAFFVQYEVADKRDPDWFTQLIVEYEDSDELQTFVPAVGASTTTPIPDQRIEAFMTNRWAWGRDVTEQLKAFRLTGTARLLHRTGFIENDFALLDQRLDIAHAPDLSSFYGARAFLNETDTQSETSFSGEIGATKRFYDSLSLTPRVFGTHAEFEEGFEQIYGGEITADYRKTIPFGLYHGTMRIGRVQEEEDFGGGTQRIVDEAQTLVGSQRERLNRPNVVSRSILVTDVTNTVVFVEGVDYEVLSFGQFTEIRRLIGTTTIADGQTVLVDYTVDVAERSSFHTNIFDLFQRYTFEDLPLAVYANFRLRDDQLESGVDPGNLNNERRLRVGAELTLGPVLLIAEYEDLDQDLAPRGTPTAPG